MKNEYANTNPTPRNDCRNSKTCHYLQNVGFSKNSKWKNTQTGVIFKCFDPKVGKAIWLPIFDAWMYTIAKGPQPMDLSPDY